MSALKSALADVVAGRSLDTAAMEAAMQSIMTGAASPVEIAAFLVALRMKGETVTEIAAAARVMRRLATPLGLPGADLLDIVGTGGDGAHLFNVSTAASFVAAACGARVAKHGNRSVSSRSGAADLLEAAGARIDLDADQVRRLIDTLGIGFLYAPKHHGAMQHAAPVRRALGLRTVFNLLGPLTHPAAAARQLLGVYDCRWLEPVAAVARELGSKHVWVVHSADGLDELSIAAPTEVVELKDGALRRFRVAPADLGVTPGPLDALRVDDAAASLARVRQALNGVPGPATEMVALNAGVALYLAGIALSPEEGVVRAREAQRAGTPAALLDRYVATTRAL